MHQESALTSHCEGAAANGELAGHEIVLPVQRHGRPTICTGTPVCRAAIVSLLRKDPT